MIWQVDIMTYLSNVFQSKMRKSSLVVVKHQFDPINTKFHWNEHSIEVDR